MISHFQQWTDHSDRKSVRKCRPLLLFSRSVMSDSFNPMDCSTLVFLVLHYLRSLLKLTSTESMRPYNHFILCHPLLLLPLIFPRIRISSNESALRIRWPKHWSFSFSISLKGGTMERIWWLPPIDGKLEKEMAPHSSTLAWKIPWTEEPGGLQSMGSLGVGHDWATSLSHFTFMHWRRKWQPTPMFLPGESQGRWSLVGCPLWGRTESDTTEAT